jgi:spermidine synthase
MPLFYLRTMIAILLFISMGPLLSSPFYYSGSTSKGEKMEFIPIEWNQLSTLQKDSHKFWFRDSIYQRLNELHFYQFDELLSIGQTPFQQYAIIRSISFGKMLFIDGELQSSQKDEQIYHESLVHPAMVLHSFPKSVLIIGAGEGAAAREVLRHPSVERLVLVDIDGEIIAQCKEFLTEWHEGSFDHPKSTLIIDDGKKFVENTEDQFDIIFIDICDRLDNSPAVELYTQQFYASLKKILKPNGIVVVQSMEFNCDLEKQDHLTVYRNLQNTFKHAVSYHSFVPSFWSVWGFILAADSAEFGRFNQGNIDLVLNERGVCEQLKYYSGDAHQKMFNYSKDEILKLNSIKNRL